MCFSPISLIRPRRRVSGLYPLHDPEDMCISLIFLTWHRRSVHQSSIPYMTQRICASGLYPLHHPEDVYQICTPYMIQKTCASVLYPLHDTEDMCISLLSLTWPRRYAQQAYIPYTTQKTCVSVLYPLCYPGNLILVYTQTFMYLMSFWMCQYSEGTSDPLAISLHLNSSSSEESDGVEFSLSSTSDTFATRVSIGGGI